MFFGLLAFVSSLYTDQARGWHAYLVAFFYFTSLSLGGLFFRGNSSCDKCGWSANYRRFSEAMASFLPIAALGAVGLLIGSKSL